MLSKPLQCFVSCTFTFFCTYTVGFVDLAFSCLYFFSVHLYFVPSEIVSVSLSICILSAAIRSSNFSASIILSSQSTLPSPFFIGSLLPVPALFLYAVCHFTRCVNGFLFPHPTSPSAMPSFTIVFVFAA